MIVYGFDSIARLLVDQEYLFKLIANERGVVVFPHTTEHRDRGRPGICYADDSQGIAIAAMVKPNLIEFRYHRNFSEQRVSNVSQGIIDTHEFSFARDFVVTYQGRTLITLNSS